MTTLAIAGWLVAIRYAITAGGPLAIFRALRDPATPRVYKVVGYRVSVTIEEDA